MPGVTKLTKHINIYVNTIYTRTNALHLFQTSFFRYGSYPNI